MHSDGIDSAPRAVPKELLEPLHTTAIGHCWADQFGLARERLHVLFPECGGSGRRNVRLSGVVGLVESEEVLRARGNSGVGCGRPASCVGTPTLKVVARQDVSFNVSSQPKRTA